MCSTFMSLPSHTFMGDEERKKGILKHARTYSNKHVDFNLDIEFVPFDETKDFTIEIQIVEEMPKKVVSYAALFAEQKAKEEAEKLAKEKGKNKKPIKNSKTKRANSFSNVNSTQDSLSSVEKIVENKIGEEPNAESMYDTNEGIDDEILVENQGKIKEQFIPGTEIQEISEINEVKGFSVIRGCVPGTTTKNEKENNSMEDKDTDEMSMNLVEISNNIEETKESLDKISEKNISQNNENNGNKIEESISLKPQNCLEIAILNDNESNLKDTSETFASFQEKNKTASVKDQFPNEIGETKSTSEESERLSDDEYQDALSNSNEFNILELNNISKNIDLDAKKLEQINLCESNDKIGKHNIDLVVPNENREKNNSFDNLVEEFESAEDQNPLSIILCNTSAILSLDENMEQDNDRNNEKQEEFIAAEIKEIENSWKKIPKCEIDSACNEQSERSTSISNFDNNNELNIKSVIKKEVVLLPPDKEEAETASNIIANQTQMENILNDSLVDETTNLSVLDINIGASSDLVRKACIDFQDVVSSKIKLGLPIANEDRATSMLNEKPFEQITALAQEDKNSSKIAHCHKEITPKERTYDKSLTDNQLDQRETEQVNSVFPLLNKGESFLNDFEHNVRIDVNESILKLKNVCEIDNQRVTERLSELP